MLLSVGVFAGGRPNILMIAVDDLKPTIAAYGDSYAKTPAMDRMAAMGTVFMNAHCQQAVCGASRASVLTGLRPDTVHVWDFKSKMRDDLPNLVTLPQYFKQAGYHTASIGKLFDYRCCDGMSTNDVPSWSQPHTMVNTPNLFKNHYAIEPGVDKKPITECLDKNVPDNFYGDGLRTDGALEMMEEFKDKKQPFFLAVGYKKPHLPFVAPKKYWDLYDRKSVPLAEYQQQPAGAPPFHYQDSWELRGGYSDIPEGILPEDMQREMVHGYYACVSYIDAQVDRLLKGLEENGLADNTIIVFWGDHGWHLGDHGMWCKHTNYEQATRVPMIIVDPRMKKQAEKVATAVEFVDITPTLTELAGLPPKEDAEGESLTALLSNADASFKEFAVSQFARSYQGPNDSMGYAFRNERYRLILWIQMAYKDGERSGPLVATELYDYKKDPLETQDLSELPEYAELHERLLGSVKNFSQEYLTINWN
jgi:arylsulfatase A-like enzyme